MFESIIMSSLVQPEIVAAIDILRVLQTATTSLKNNLIIFVGVAAAASIVIGGLFFLSRRRGAENGKIHVSYMLMGVGAIPGTASIITSLFGLFEQTPRGL